MATSSITRLGHVAEIDYGRIRCSRRRRLAAAVLAAAVLAPEIARCDSHWTFDGDGSWSDTTKWFPFLPGPTDITLIVHGDAIARNVTLDVDASILDLVIGNAGTGTNTLTQNNNFNLTTQYEIVGNTNGSPGHGWHIQSAGSNMYTGSGTGGLSVGGFYGTDLHGLPGLGGYVLSGGAVQVNHANLAVGSGSGGQGTFNQSAGTVSVSNGTFVVGADGINNLVPSPSSGTYLLSGTANLNASITTELIGVYGDGTFIQTGGMNTISGSALVLGQHAGATGYYMLSAGTLNVNNLELVGVDGAGTFDQTGGVHTVTGLFDAGSTTGAGTYLLSGGTLNVFSTNEIIGDSPAGGTFIQSGGVHQIGTELTPVRLNLAGNSGTRGTYLLNDGTLNVSFDENVGAIAAGTFIQSGGVHVIGSATSPANLNIPLISGATGFFLLNNGSLTVNGDTILGGNGGGATGILTLSGGSMTVTGALAISTSLGASSINLQGATLSVGTLNTTAFLAGFHWTSGTLIYRDSLVLDPLAMTLDTANITAPEALTVTKTTSGDGSLRVTLNGGTFTTGSLSSGSLVQFNTGTFRLTDASLTIGSSGLFGSTLTLNALQHIDIPNGPVNINSLAQLVMTSDTAFLSGGPLTSKGTISGTGQIANNITNNGDINASGTDVLHFTGSTNTSSGNIVLHNGGEIDFTGSLVNTGLINGRGVISAFGGLTNEGQFLFAGGSTGVIGVVTNNGLVTVSGGNTTTFHQDVDTTVGSITIDATSSVVFLGNVLGLNQLSGPGTKDFEARGNGGALATITGNTFVGVGGNILADNIRENALNNSGHVTIGLRETPNDPSGTSIVKSLTLNAGSVLDLTDNSMIVDYTGAVGTLADDVRGHLRARRLNSSAATSTRRLGYADNAVLHRSTFAGQPVDSTSILIKYTYAGDADLDGDADGVDIGTWATNFTGELGGTGSTVWTQGDWDYDGDVDGVDAGLWAQAFTGELGGAGLGSLIIDDPNIAPGAAAILRGLGITVLPEPGIAGSLAGIAALALNCYRRRRKWGKP
ncbi:MAG TPA: hypothetical protein VH518_13955 [Tepidisphaeraceae bacterium]|jgi:hypothetical protein